MVTMDDPISERDLHIIFVRSVFAEEVDVYENNPTSE